MFSRYFILTDPKLIEHLTNWRAACDVVHEKRTAFLEGWGSHIILTGGPGGLHIRGIADPRKMDPPRPLPKGWKRITRYPSHVEATSRENQALLHSLRNPHPQKIDNEILTRIAMQDPFNEARIFGDDKPEHRAARTDWDAPTETGLGQTTMFSIGYQSFPDEAMLPPNLKHVFDPVQGPDVFWVVMIPDEALKFKALRGMEEIFAWQFQEMLPPRHYDVEGSQAGG